MLNYDFKLIIIHFQVMHFVCFNKYFISLSKKKKDMIDYLVCFRFFKENVLLLIL